MNIIEGSKILVTGGAGFIGSHLVKRLLDEGFKVAVLDNLSGGSIGNLQRYLGKEQFIFRKGDITDEREVNISVKDIDMVIHLAALTSVTESFVQPSIYEKVNAIGTVNLLKASRNLEVQRFIYASTTAVYGEPEKLPLTEEDPTDPISPYGSTKLAGEHNCQLYQKKHNLDTVILRLFNVYGEGQRCGPYSGVITNFINNALNGDPFTIYGDGEQTRNYIHVDDVVESLVLALKNERAAGEVFNICAATPTSVNQLAETINDLLDRSMEIRHVQERKGDIRHNYGDPSKAARILEFNARTTLQDGLRRLLDHVKKNPAFRDDALEAT